MKIWQKMGFRFYAGYVDAMITGLEIGDQIVFDLLGEGAGKARTYLNQNKIGEFSTNLMDNGKLLVTRLS